MANTKVTSFQVQGNRYGLEPDLTFDTTPTAGSTNPVTSNGIYTAISAAAIGTDISVGRTDGSQIGYCSIAFGSNITASADYTIVFGKDNLCCSAGSIVSGYGNYCYGGDYQSSTPSNLALGNGNHLSGYYCSAIGYGNSIGTKIQDVTLVTPTSYDTIYGYFDPGTKKLYYDEEKTSEHEIHFDNLADVGSLYIVDLTSLPPNRNPGDIYEFTRNTNQTIVVKKMDNRYVRLTDKCHNITYTYMGPCYYDNPNDKAYYHYSGGSFSDEIDAQYMQYGMVYFDLISDTFIFYCKYIGEYPLNTHPDWLKIITCKGYTTNTKDPKFGRHAYVYTASDNVPKKWHVYSSPAYEDTTDITSQLLDGEIVVDLSYGGLYLYRFNADHILSYVIDATKSITTHTATSPWYFCTPQGYGSLALGYNNYTTGVYGSIVSGYGNEITRSSEGSAVFGQENSLSIGYTTNAKAYCLVSGYRNKITTPSREAHTFIALGYENTYTMYGNNDRNYIIGTSNSFVGETSNETYIYGYHNSLTTLQRSIIIGSYNTAQYQNDGCVIGVDNVFGKVENMISYGIDGTNDTINNVDFVKLTTNESGILEGDGVTYNASTGTYTFQQRTIYKVYSISDAYGTTDNAVDRTVNDFQYYAYSSDGRTLTELSSGATAADRAMIFGNDNYYSRLINVSLANPYSTGNSGNYIIGSHNVLRLNGGKTVGLIGHHLLFTFDKRISSHQFPEGAIYLGAYNTLNELRNGTKAQFVVGIGTSDEDRRNGLVIYNDGNVVTPSAGATIEEAMSRNPTYNANNLVITYGMLQAYAPKTPGAIGKPAVAIINLEVASWSSFEQTVTLSGITASSVVIIQPSGNPHAFYVDEVYLYSQSDDTLTFKCSAVPSNDMTVKVVYWA